MKLKQENKISKLRLFSLIIGAYLLVLISGQASLFLVSGIIMLALIYALWREYIWVLLVLSIPSLTLGKIVNIPISSGWVYEARIAEIFLGIAAIIFFLDIFLKNKIESLKFDKIAFVLLLFSAVSIASIFYAESFRLYVFGLKVIVFSFLAYLMAINLLDTKRKIKFFYYSLALTAVVLSGQIFYRFYQIGFSAKFFFERNTIMVPLGPIALTSAILAFLSPILLGLYYDESRKKGEGIYYYLAVTVSILAVFLTLGKGAILSLLAGLALIFFRTKNKVPFLLFFFWFLAIGLIVFNPFFTGLFERLKTTFVDKNTDFRVLEYRTGWELIKSNPVYGVGAGQQIYHFPKILNLDKGNFVNNYVFQAMIDLGVIGLAIILTLSKDIFASVYRNLRRYGYQSMLAVSFAGAFLCAFLNGMVEVTFYALPYAIIFWLVTGAYFSHMKLLERNVYEVEYTKPIQEKSP